MTVYSHANTSLFSSWRFLGVLLIGAAIFTISTPLFFAINYNAKVILLSATTLSIGLLLSTTFDGLQLDLKNKKQRDFIAILGFKRGDWRPIEAISAIIASSHSRHAQNTPNGISPTLSGTVTLYKLTAYSDLESLFTLWFHQKEKARHLGKMMSDHFKIQLQDNID